MKYIEKNKKILIFCDYFLPGTKAGGPVRSITNLIEILKKYTDISVITRNHDWGEKKRYSGVESNKWNATKSYNIFYIDKKLITYFNISKFILSGKYDIVYLNSIFSIFSFLTILTFYLKKPHLKLIIAPRGELNENALKLKSFKKKIYLFIIALVVKKIKMTWQATNELEYKNILNNFGGNSSICLTSNIPNQNQINLCASNKISGILRLLFVSRIDKMKNLNFILELLKSFDQPGISLDIYGSSNDQNYYNKCLSLAQSFDNVKITFRGYVDYENISYAIESYDFFILPTLGENFGHAIFESLSYGIPVIISDKTPWHTLATTKVGWFLSLDNKNEWINVIKECIEMDNQTYATISKNAWNFANEYMMSPTITKQIMDLFELN